MASKKPTATDPEPTVAPVATATYVVTGRILRNGQVLRPANPAIGRQADTAELTEREADSLRGFVALATKTPE